MENKMYTKQQFKCAICGQIYDEIKDRVDCESKCLKKQEVEAKKAAEVKKREEQATRKAAVDAAYDTADKACETADKLRDEYVHDYGVYTRFSGKVSNAPECQKFGDILRLWLDY